MTLRSCILALSATTVTSAQGMGYSTVEADVSRTSSYSINTGDSSFAGARGVYEIGWNFAAELDDFKQGVSVGNPGTDLTIFTRRTARDFFASGTGDVEISNVQFDPNALRNGSLIVDWQLTSHDPFDLHIDGSLIVGYEFDALEPAASGGRSESFLVTRIEHDRSIMRFVGGGEGLVDVGDRFTVDLEIDGRWDPDAEGYGSVDFIGIDDSFVVLEFFTYDQTSDTTRFLAVSDSYSRNPDLEFDLIGRVVPPPSSLALLFGTSFMARRYRANAQ